MSNVDELIELGCCKDCDQDVCSCLADGNCYYDKKHNEQTLKNELKETFKLELKKENLKEKEIFYKYRYKNFIVLFTQKTDSGNIYSVSVKSSYAYVYHFDIYVDCLHTYYPSSMECSFYSFRVESASDIEVVEKTLTDVKDLMKELKLFFEYSDHADLYKEHHKEEV